MNQRTEWTSQTEPTPELDGVDFVGAMVDAQETEDLAAIEDATRLRDQQCGYCWAPDPTE